MGITYYSPPNNDFTELYISLRKTENRFYSEEQIRNLPDIEKNHIHYKEWQLRKKSALRFVEYLKSKNRPLRILDVGCGNGWFSHLMSTVGGTEVIGLDVNFTELNQADAIFKKPNLEFACADLNEKTELNNEQFDLIVFNSCLQYFSNPSELFNNLAALLHKDGEIHIIDSPFYQSHAIQKARQRTKIYYTDLGFPEMAANYFHHQIDFERHIILYRPATGFLARLKNDSPFYWIKIVTD
jgi:2-polyprenyl-3-methyl-5-hydroxy-6-metoxy-1,4-benzoquinol methylase